MNTKKIIPFLYLFCLTILLEVTLFNISFWKTYGNVKETGYQQEIIYSSVHMEDMHEAAAGEADSEPVIDEEGFTHVTGGSLLIRLTGLDCQVEQIGLKLALPQEAQVKASVYMRDEGNAYTYQLGQERTIWEWVPESSSFLVYPYGRVRDIYISLTAPKGQELVCALTDVEVNGQMPFRFLMSRTGIVYLLLLLIYCLHHKSGFERILFWPSEMEKPAKRKRMLAIGLTAAVFILLSAMSVLANPVCRQNLGQHHAQYQELAAALRNGEVAVGIADERLLSVENPYDTIHLQANQIPYMADYAYKDGLYYVYFGIVPELLCYLPYHILTGKALPNYMAVLLFMTGFTASCAGLVYEIMRRYFARVPFYLYPVCLFMLVFGYPLFYLQLRPDLYHVPIAASCMFTALSLWLVMTGSRMEKYRPYLWGAGALCMAANAGCRPQFLLFSLLLLPLCMPYLLRIFKKDRNGRLNIDKDRRSQLKTLAAMALSYLVVAAGIMYYNQLRFGSMFDFGATYSMTSNDMTHRGFNLSRIFYSAWYYLFEPARIEGVFPYIRSAVIEADYMGRLVSESCFGGIFACSMLYWPVFAVFRCRRRLQDKKLFWTAFLGILISLVICGADASGAGVLQRYMADQMPGIAFAAVLLLLVIAEWAMEKDIFHHFSGWLTAAILLHLAFLLLILINTDSSVNICKGNPHLFAAIWSMLQF